MEGDEGKSAPWRSENGNHPPKKVVPVDDSLTADSAYRLVCEGVGLLWQGDFHNARQMLQALARRADTPRVSAKDKKAAKAAKAGTSAVVEDSAQAFHRYRMAQAQRAHLLSRLLIPVTAEFQIPLRRAPDVQAACADVYGSVQENFVISLRELQGIVGAHEWHKKGVDIPALDARIHPHYGVFSPVRGEYLDLIAQAPLPALTSAFDIGTGTGVIAALLAKRGVKRIVATDNDARALACAQDNIERLGLTQQVRVAQADLFPSGRAALVVCNPPWIPGKAGSTIEAAIYDQDNRMLIGFLEGVPQHLEPKGEAWLILSDIAEHLGVRTRDDLQAIFDRAGLQVIARHDTKPTHPRAADKSDPLHAARSAELTSLWRLQVKE